VLGCSAGESPPGSGETIGRSATALSVGQLGNHDNYFVWQRLAGIGADEVLAGDNFGAAFASGTLNNDTFADLVVGAPGDDAGAADGGAVFIFGGASGGAHTGTRRSQSGQNARLGWSVAVGDFNGDTLTDIAAGAPGQEKNGPKNVGKIYVWYGESGEVHNWTGPATSFWSSELNCGGDEEGDEFGFALAAGDFNGDQVTDLAIGAPGENANNNPVPVGGAAGEGLVCIALGQKKLGQQPGGLTSGLGRYYFQNTLDTNRDRVAGDRYGHALAAGDVTGDSVTDLVIGAPGEDGGRGQVQVLRGVSGGTLPNIFSSPQTLTQGAAGDPQPNDRFGSALAIGNFNKAGPRDVAVGSPNDLRGTARSGLICTFAGGSTLGGAVCLDQSPVVNASNEAGDEFGSSLAAGDFDRDGDDDLAVGVPGDGAGSEPATSGMVVLFEGGTSGLGSGTWFNQESTAGNSESGDRFGGALGSGDLDGDGAPDLVIGSPGEGADGAPAGSGIALVVPGRAQNLLLTHGPIIGAVTESTARIWARTNRPAEMRVLASCTGCNSPVPQVVSLGNAKDATGVAQLSGLSAGKIYNYTVSLAESGSGQFTQVYSGTFKTIPPNGGLTFVVGADMKERYAPYPIFAHVAAKNPDVFFNLGDNVYADGAFDKKESFEAFYKRNYSDSSFRSFMAKTSTQMIWDDHDIYDDWACDDNKWSSSDSYVDCQGNDRYLSARAAFDEYAGALNPPTPFALSCPMSGGRDCEQHAPIYYTYSARQVDFFVLDTRTYRRKSDGEMLGATQLKALETWLEQSSGKFKVILSSVPFHQYSTTGGDSWDGADPKSMPPCTPVGQFRQEMQAIFDSIRSANVLGVVLVSGDQHWAGMFEHDVDGVSGGVKVHEFMPTPLGVNARPMACPLPAGAVGVSGGRYFGLFKFTDGATPKLQYNLIDQNGQSQHCKIIDRTGAIDATPCQ
jgi:phosphodiesterase/alkaline phosphatase D-like protein